MLDYNSKIEEIILGCKYSGIFLNLFFEIIQKLFKIWIKNKPVFYDFAKMF